MHGAGLLGGIALVQSIPRFSTNDFKDSVKHVSIKTMAIAPGAGLRLCPFRFQIAAKRGQ